MKKIITAVLIDTIAIQDYIFTSNRLKDNLGASYIVEYELKAYLKEVLSECFSGAADFDAWSRAPQTIKIIEDPTCTAEVAYIGGGKSMLFFRDKEHATNFIKAYSLKILIAFPGLRLAFGVLENYDLDQFQQSQEQLAQKLIENKNQFYRNVQIPKQGITADCPRSNEVVEYATNGDGDNELEFISATSYVKETFGNIAHQKLNTDQQWKDILGEHFLFTNQLDDLGLPEQGRYIALVHVDGNSMGTKFIECQSLPELRKLSTKVSDTSQSAMQDLIRYVVGLFSGDSGELCLNGTSDETFSLQKINNKDKEKFPGARWYLPVRPIIIAGDDITFVCEGRLGVHLAKKMVDLLQQSELSIQSCAGVAVVKAKYPFARAYHLAEELTLAAKAKSKEQNGASYLDFIISSSGFSGSLPHIRDQQFKNADGVDFHFGPYRLDGEDSDDSFALLHKRISDFANNGKWNRTKVMALREALFQDEGRQGLFLQKATADGLYERDEKLYQDQKTLDFEAIELLDFYPQILLACN